MLKGTGTLGTSLVLETDGIMTRQRVQNQILTRPYDDRHFAVRLPSLSLWRSTHCSEHMDAHTHLHISSESLSHTHCYISGKSIVQNVEFIFIVCEFVDNIMVVTCKYPTVLGHFSFKGSTEFSFLNRHTFCHVEVFSFSPHSNWGSQDRGCLFLEDCKALYSKTGICDFELQMS